jgi:hypothetical protein
MYITSEGACYLNTNPEERREDTRSSGMGNARAERARVAGKMAVTLLSVYKAAARLGTKGAPLGSTPRRTPPFYTSSTNTGEFTC